MTKTNGYEERSVVRAELEYGVSAGIRLRSLSQGLVPIFEEHQARLERGIDLDTWGRMDCTEKALIIAVRRVHVAMQNQQSEAEIRHNNRK